MARNRVKAARSTEYCKEVQIGAVSISLGWATSDDVAFFGCVKVVRYPYEDAIPCITLKKLFIL